MISCFGFSCLLPLLLVAVAASPTAAFVVTGRNVNSVSKVVIPQPIQQQARIMSLHETVIDDDVESNRGISPPEETVYDILQEMHDSRYPFRLVVVGNGAILETTSPLGPTFKLGNSPRTGENLVTFASEDQSFEFHIMIAQVSKIVMTSKENPQGKTMNVFRFLTSDGKPMCSLILADKSEDANKWFNAMLEKHNNGDVQL